MTAKGLVAANESTIARVCVHWETNAWIAKGKLADARSHLACRGEPECLRCIFDDA
jgi:hypothetical protein